MGIVRGRIAGGVAILWHKKLDNIIKVLGLKADWCIADQICVNNKDFVILNIYTPYESHQNEEKYLNRLASINSFISASSSTSVFIVADMNADLSDQGSLFAKHMLQFCDDNNLVISSHKLLPAGSYSYISEAWHSTSWLDHCSSTADAHTGITSMEIVYETLTDHIPFVMVLDCDNLPELSSEVNTDSHARLIWAKLTREDVFSYSERTDNFLKHVFLLRDATLCFNVNCNDNSHREDLCSMYNSIARALYEASACYKG